MTWRMLEIQLLQDMTMGYENGIFSWLEYALGDLRAYEIIPFRKMVTISERKIYV